MFSSLIIYGANGYTGELIAREAVRRGWRPVLAGRSADAIGRLAQELGLPARVFGLEPAHAVDTGLAGMRVVLHCAGPFERTYRPMADACLRARAHYLDITGEASVFEGLAARDSEARAAGMAFLPGVGFDVVPSDSLAAHLKRRLPSATRLSLAFQPVGRASRGTATTALENLHRGGLVRRGGRLTRVPAAYLTRQVDFGRGARTVVSIPWGDVATAYHTTGIPDITVYLAAPASLRLFLRASRLLRPLLATQAVRGFLKRRVQAGPPGPSALERERGLSLLWGLVENDAGERAEARLRGPEGYTFTVQTALLVAERALTDGLPPGFQTPARVLGPDAVLALAGTQREDV